MPIHTWEFNIAKTACLQPALAKKQPESKKGCYWKEMSCWVKHHESELTVSQHAHANIFLILHLKFETQKPVLLIYQRFTNQPKLPLYSQPCLKNSPKQRRVVNGKRWAVEWSIGNWNWLFHSLPMQISF